MSEILELLVSPTHRWSGRPDTAAAVTPDDTVTSLTVRAGLGIVGDRYFNRPAARDASVTLLASESLAAWPGAGLQQLRRNVLLHGVDVDAGIGRVLSLDSGDGPVRFALNRPARPCAWLDLTLAPGARSALRTTGGVRCTPLSDGRLSVGPVTARWEAEAAPGDVSSTPTIRPAVAADLPMLTLIYNHYVRTSIATFDTEPSTPAQRADWFAHYSADGPHRLLVAELEGTVVGYATSSTYRLRAGYDHTVETSVYLAPPAAGRGVGSVLYGALLAHADADGIHRCLAHIALPNDGSEALHRRFGFQRLGRFSEVGRKFDQWIDVAWYERAPAR